MKEYHRILSKFYEERLYDEIPITLLGRDKYGYLSEKQKKALDKLRDGVTTHVGYGGSARSGKTILEAFWITLQCLTYPGVRYAVGREELKRLRTRTLGSFYELWGFWNIEPGKDYEFNNQDHIIRFSNGSEILLIEMKTQPRDPDFLRFGGLELTGAAVDESNESTQKAIDTLFTRVGWRYNDKYGIPNKMLETFNPNKSHVYFRYWQPFRDKKETPNKTFIPALPGDNPHPSVSAWIKGVMETGDETLIERLVRGNFDYDDDPKSLVDYRAIADIFTNKHADRTGRSRISADLAMKGRDRFVAGHWEGLVGFVDIDKEKAGAKEIEEDLEELAFEVGVSRRDIVADADGLGAYLSDYLEGIEEFHGNARPNDPQYANLKSECAFKLAELINNGELYIVCTKDQQDRIAHELSVCLRKKTLDDDEAKKRIISKDEMRERLGHSPDYFDWMNMRMIWEVETIYQIGAPTN